MKIEVGKCYYHKVSAMASVRKVLAIYKDGDIDRVKYETLHGPVPHGSTCQRLNKFSRWAHGVIEELDNYSHLDGYSCFVWKTFIVCNTQGKAIFRCGEKRARFYLRKGYANEIEEGVIQFTNDVTETRLKELYDNFNEFFMEVKNDRCVCCGAKHRLTRHHVVPQRMKKLIPQPWRSCLSNILFLCIKCHRAYEQYISDHGEPDIVLGDDALLYARLWKDHFVSVMNPQFIPKGWDIVTVKNIEAAGKINGPKPTCGRDEGDCQAESA